MAIETKSSVIRYVLTHIDQDLSDFIREKQRLEIEPHHEMPIDAAVDYARRNLASEESIVTLFEQYDEKRRSLLARLPELKPYLDRIVSTDLAVKNLMRQGIVIDREQVAQLQQAAQAFHSNNAPVWNSAMERMNVLKSEYATLEVRTEQIFDQQSEIMGEAKSMLQRELISFQETAGNIIKLKNAADKGYGLHPDVCSLSTITAADELGIHDFDGITGANDQVDYMIRNWVELSREQAQEYANNGIFVVAGMKGVNHTMVVVPGNMKTVPDQVSYPMVKGGGSLPGRSDGTKCVGECWSVADRKNVKYFTKKR